MTSQNNFDILDVLIRPVVLLSVVDHYKRMNAKRVIGILLGEIENNTIFISNSFAIPFEENEDCWYYDTSYLEKMLEMSYKINPMEKLVGWYHTNENITNEDNNITKSFKRYTNSPLMISVDVNSKTMPINCFKLIENELRKTSIKIETGEAEEVGVEHLLKNYHDQSRDFSNINVNEIKKSLNAYENCLTKIIKSLEMMENNGVCNKKLNAFHDCLNMVQRCRLENKNSSEFYISDNIKETFLFI